MYTKNKNDYNINVFSSNMHQELAINAAANIHLFDQNDQLVHIEKFKAVLSHGIVKLKKTSLDIEIE